MRTNILRSHKTRRTRDRSIPRSLQRRVSMKPSISHLTFKIFFKTANSATSIPLPNNTWRAYNGSRSVDLYLPLQPRHDKPRSEEWNAIVHTELCYDVGHPTLSSNGWWGSTSIIPKRFTHQTDHRFALLCLTSLRPDVLLIGMLFVVFRSWSRTICTTWCIFSGLDLGWTCTIRIPHDIS